jgi:hypothetical protein
MIDIAAILLFSSLIVYTVFRAIKLDKLLPWFSANSDEQVQQLQQQDQAKGLRRK